MKRKIFLFFLSILIGIALIINSTPKTAIAEENRDVCMSDEVCETILGTDYTNLRLEDFVLQCCKLPENQFPGCKEGYPTPIPITK